MYNPLNLLLDSTFFSTSTLCFLLTAYLIGIALSLFFTRSQPYAARKLRQVVYALIVVSATPIAADQLYPFYVLNRHVSCFGCVRGTVPHGLLHHPTRAEITAIEIR